MINLNYFFSIGIQEKIARSIVLKMSQPKQHANGKVYYMINADACLKIVMNYYRDVIMDDIAQGIAETMIEMNQDGLLFEFRTLFQRRLCYLPIEVKETDDDGNEITTIKSSYNKFYGTVGTVLGNYSNHQLKGGILPMSDLIYTDDNGEDHSITLRASNFLNMSAAQFDGDFTDLFNRGDVSKFIKYLDETEKPQKVDDILKVIDGLLLGMTRQEIADGHGLTIKRVDYLIKCMRDTWTSGGFKVWLSRQKVSKWGRGAQFDIIPRRNYRTDKGTKKLHVMRGSDSSYSFELYQDTTPWRPTTKTIDISHTSLMETASADYEKKVTRSLPEQYQGNIRAYFNDIRLHGHTVKNPDIEVTTSKPIETATKGTKDGLKALHMVIK